MPEVVQIEVDGKKVPFTLDDTKEKGRWTAPDDVAAGSFPLTGESGGRRFELYSDGTFAEIEL